MLGPCIRVQAKSTSAGPDGGQDDFVEAATSLFQDVAVAVEENESFMRAAFGAEAQLSVITSLHGEVGTDIWLNLRW